MDYAQIAILFVIYTLCLVGCFGRSAGGFFQFFSGLLLTILVPASFFGLAQGHSVHIEAVVSFILACAIYFGFSRKSMDEVWHKKSEADAKLGDCDDSVKDVLLNSVMEDKPMTNKNLSKAEFSHVRFKRCDFEGSIFNQSTFYGGDISYCSFSKASFVKTFIDKTRFSCCDFTLTDFNHCEVGGVFSDCTFLKTQFEKAELGGSRRGWPFSFSAEKSKFVEVDFSKVKRSVATFSHCDFSCSDFSCAHSIINAFECVFEDCNFEKALISGQIENSVFQGVPMRGARLMANFIGCDFSDSNVEGADFSSAIIYGSNLMNTNVTQEQIDSTMRYDMNNEFGKEHLKVVVPPLLPKGIVWEI